MLHDDLKVLLDRLDRIASAIDIGCDSVEADGRTEVFDAMVETCWESIRIGHVLTRALAYGELWSELDVLVAIWRRIDAQAGRVRIVDARATPAAEAARAVVDGLSAVVAATREVDEAQLLAVARPRDRSAASRAAVAIAELEAAADRFFVDALAEDRHGRLDAALALLTTVAARASRERNATSARRG